MSAPLIRMDAGFEWGRLRILLDNDYHDSKSMSYDVFFTFVLLVRSYGF